MNASWQKPNFQNLGTGPLDASINVDGVTDLRGSLSLVKTGVSRILQTRRNASD